MHTPGKTLKMKGMRRKKHHKERVRLVSFSFFILLLFYYLERRLTVYSPAERIGSPTIVNYDFSFKFRAALDLSAAKSGATWVGLHISWITIIIVSFFSFMRSMTEHVALEWVVGWNNRFQQLETESQSLATCNLSPVHFYWIQSLPQWLRSPGLAIRSVSSSWM